MKDYALYKGDNLLGIGNALELSELIDVKIDTIYFYATNSHKERIGENGTIAVSLEED